MLNVQHTKIYNDIVLKFLKNSKEDNSKKIARVDMAYDIVEVLEGYVHYYISTIITVIASIGYIYLTNWKVGLLVTLALFFVICAVLIFYKKIKQAINIKNNHYEKKIISIQDNYNVSVSFFNRQRKLGIFLSNLEGKKWYLVSTIRTIFLILSIITLVVTSNNITVGNIISVYSYVDNFLISLMSIPVTFEMISRLSDIIQRID